MGHANCRGKWVKSLPPYRLLLGQQGVHPGCCGPPTILRRRQVKLRNLPSFQAYHVRVQLVGSDWLYVYLSAARADWVRCSGHLRASAHHSQHYNGGSSSQTVCCTSSQHKKCGYGSLGSSCSQVCVPLQHRLLRLHTTWFAERLMQWSLL